MNLINLCSLFEEKDQDRDKAISFHELKQFLKEIKFRKLNSDDETTASEMMEDFDRDNDEKITVDEFVTGMTKWLDDTKDAMTKRYHSVKSLKDMYQVHFILKTNKHVYKYTEYMNDRYVINCRCLGPGFRRRGKSVK